MNQTNGFLLPCHWQATVFIGRQSQAFRIECRVRFQWRRRRRHDKYICRTFFYWNFLSLSVTINVRPPRQRFQTFSLGASRRYLNVTPLSTLSARTIIQQTYRIYLIKAYKQIRTWLTGAITAYSTHTITRSTWESSNNLLDGVFRVRQLLATHAETYWVSHCTSKKKLKMFLSDFASIDKQTSADECRMKYEMAWILPIYIPPSVCRLHSFRKPSKIKTSTRQKQPNQAGREREKGRRKKKQNTNKRTRQWTRSCDESMIWNIYICKKCYTNTTKSCMALTVATKLHMNA